MLDYVIRNGLVVDGTGAPGRKADVGVRDGKIVALGEVTETGTAEFDAEGLVVAPGIIDPHTHYDAQLFWDATASPSNLHGVNAGFLVGHCAIRRWVMGDERASEVATDDEITAMSALLADSIEAGGLGFSSSQSRTHSLAEGCDSQLSAP
jgi:N-acyl-D-aspartate/D-glutamate deacylase